MNTPAAGARSNFVTVLAWVMLAFGVFSILMALMQTVLVNLLLPAFDSVNPAGAPPALLLAFFRAAMLAGLAFSAFMTYGAYALLKRRNWARILYCIMFIFSAVLHVLIAAALAFGSDFVMLPLADAGSLPPEFRSAFRMAAMTCAILLLAFSVGYVWLARRLLSPAIAAEFGVVSRPAL